MIKIVLDSNIIISSLLFGGNPRKIMNLIIKGELQLGISYDTINELKNVLIREKFHLSTEFVQKFIQELELLSHLVILDKKLNVIQNDPDDNRILECALTYHADYIISGDKHLLNLKEYKQIPIYSPIIFLKKFFI